MNWEVVAVIVFVAFFGGLLLISRVLAWVAGLILVVKSPGTQPSAKVGFSLAQVFLHSGPWSLALGIGALYYAASLPQQIWLWATLGGFALAGVLLAVTIVLAHLRQRRGTLAPTLLTPERLLKTRRRFFWGTTILFGGSTGGWLLYSMWPLFGQSAGLIAMIIATCLVGGYGFSWFMWQFHGAALQAREDARKQAQRSNAV